MGQFWRTGTGESWIFILIWRHAIGKPSYKLGLMSFRKFRMLRLTGGMISLHFQSSKIKSEHSKYNLEYIYIFTWKDDWTRSPNVGNLTSAAVRNYRITHNLHPRLRSVLRFWELLGSRLSGMRLCIPPHGYPLNPLNWQIDNEKTSH